MHQPLREPESEGKVVLAVAKTEEELLVHFLTPARLHISAPARSGRLGRGKRGEGPAREALQHSVTLLAPPPPPRDDISTRWLF